MTCCCDVVTSHDSGYGMRRAQPHRARRAASNGRLIDSDSLVTMITFIHSSFRSDPSGRHSVTRDDDDDDIDIDDDDFCARGDATRRTPKRVDAIEDE